MRAARHVHVRVPSPTLLQVLRRSLVLALATFATLLTLLLPAPAMARPVNLTSGSVAASGSAPSGAVPHTGRRTHRGEHARSGRSVAGPSSTGGADPWFVSGVSAVPAVVGGSSGSGVTLVAALSPSPSSVTRPLGLVRSPDATGAAVLALAGARSSRAPPTL
jgi:hypothetical protein